MSVWRHCSSCRAPIGFSTTYWVCSVSTCARVAKTGLFFCSVGCWEMHLPTMRHREAWAVEERSPTEAQWRQRQDEEAERESAPARPAPAAAEPAASREVRRQVVAPPAQRSRSANVEREILIVVSKLKKYVKASSEMNTSDNVMPVLSDHLRKLCDMACDKAAEDGRKTVMDRDFLAILRG